ncbi:MAG TPA: hypothetical protein VF173_06720 [Thermoanaerobaculia bacterium]|nr:hypothetical protein [Thermoanaerobaculia bacterium]
MVAEAESRSAVRRETEFPYAGRLVLTVVLLAVYYVMHKIPLPFVQGEIPWSSAYSAQANVLALGITPLIGGFIVIELFSLMTSKGRELRAGGAAGRARLNRVALIASLVIAAFQGWGIASLLEYLSYSGRMSIVDSPGPAFTFFTILTLTAATAMTFGFGQLLSAYGIGNGFALITLLNIGSVAVSLVGGDLRVLGTWLPDAAIVLGLAVLAYLFIRSGENKLIPAFPQGVLAVQWSSRIVFYALRIGVLGELFLRGSPVWRIGAELIVIALLSWLTYHWFSSRPRLEANLSEPAEDLDDLAAVLKRRAFVATGVLLAGAAAGLVWGASGASPVTDIFGFSAVVSAVAIGLDLYDQLRFHRRHGQGALLTQLDNVYFSYFLEQRLQEAEIPALARGHHFRSLLFFFGALYKIDVFVPTDQLDRARGVLADLEMAREVRVF